jgi:hypothetical protein
MKKKLLPDIKGVTICLCKALFTSFATLYLYLELMKIKGN